MTLHAKRNSPGRAAGAAALLMALAGGLTSCAPHYLVEPAPPGPGASMDALLVRCRAT